MAAGRDARARARWATSPPPSRRWPTPTSATPSPTTAAPRAEALPGFKPSIPVVWCGLYPVDADDFEKLRDSLAKLRLNDASFHFEAESSRGAGLRLPLRLPRPAAPGDHPGAAVARVRPRPDRDRALASSTSCSMNDGTERELHNPADMPDPTQDRHDRGALDQGDDLRARRVPRQHPDAVQRAARPAGGADLCRQPRHGGLSPAAERGGLRLLRPAEVGLPRLCQLRLPDGRLRGGRPREDQHPREQRAGGRAVLHGAPRPGGAARPLDLREAEGPDPPPALQDPHPGRDRRPGHRARDHRRHVART